MSDELASKLTDIRRHLLQVQRQMSALHGEVQRVSTDVAMMSRQLEDVLDAILSPPVVEIEEEVTCRGNT